MGVERHTSIAVSTYPARWTTRVTGASDEITRFTLTTATASMTTITVVTVVTATAAVVTMVTRFTLTPSRLKQHQQTDDKFQQMAHSAELDLDSNLGNLVLYRVPCDLDLTTEALTLYAVTFILILKILSLTLYPVTLICPWRYWP